ncbi:HAD family hydrolase [Streptomyces armeniacus]|uniref:HAD family hydrolase n=1 Tax=Streptomyces armeniacus TaxID=83291 RepID=A0A345XKH8_9ACTN|nr:HAD-IA family hydrolase [Streptomyces armeniacus]AXK32144.1 HAD family hydrolase [Streptomyces armeniacus]
MKLSADALLFDNDGTLLSSMESVIRCWTRWAGEHGVTEAEFAQVELHGRTAAEIISELLPAAEVPGAVRRIEQLEVEDVGGGVVLLPGTAALVSALSAAPAPWAVVTSAIRPLAEARLREVGVEPPLVIAAEDVVRGKPDPEPFLLAARKLGADPARCVVFEDAPAGLEAARAAGMRTVALTTTHAREELRADAVVTDLSGVSVQVTASGVEILTEA